MFFDLSLSLEKSNNSILRKFAILKVKKDSESQLSVIWTHLVHFYLSMNPSVYRPFYLSMNPSVYWPFYLSMNPSVYWPFYLSMNPSVYWPFYLSMNPNVYRPRSPYPGEFLIIILNTYQEKKLNYFYTT